MSRTIEAGVPLAPLTTLGVGGSAPSLVHAANEADVAAAVRDLRGELTVLGGGSNVLIADAGLRHAVLQVTDTSFEVVRRDDSYVDLAIGAGLEWDAVVAEAVRQGFRGVECLSGIPGRVGAAPIQNIGAYGQEVAEHLSWVRYVDRDSGAAVTVTAEHCGFGYRTSRFKRDWRDRCVVVKIGLRLPIGGAPDIRYPELAKRLEADSGFGPGAASLQETRDAVLEIRRSKSMVFDRSDPNHRSAGSFFMNPIVALEHCDEVRARAQALGHDPDRMPAFPVPHPPVSTAAGSVSSTPADPAAGTQSVKLSAAWLIERSGFAKGLVDGECGLSTNHCLALINRGSANASDIVRLAGRIRRGVRSEFGVSLHPEPVFLGFGESVEALLESSN